MDTNIANCKVFFVDRKLDFMQNSRIDSTVRVCIDIICRYNQRVICKNQHKGVFCCPIQDSRFTALLDFYFEGPDRSEARGVRDPRAVQNLKQIEIASWFDDDFSALDVYGQWKVSGKLSMTQTICRQFRRAWARYYTRLQPLGQKPPNWLKGYTKWRGVSLGYQKKFGVL